jgi:hypothetical protein
MKIGKVVILVLVLAAAGYFSYTKGFLSGKAKVPPIPQPDKTALAQFTLLSQKDKPFTYLLPVTKEIALTADSYNAVSETVTSIVEVPFSSLSASQVSYADGRSGYRILYDSPAPLKEEFTRLKELMLTPEYSKISGLLKENGAYIMQVRGEITIFVEIRANESGVSVELFSVENVAR